MISNKRKLENMFQNLMPREMSLTDSLALLTDFKALLNEYEDEIYKEVDTENMKIVKFLRPHIETMNEKLNPTVLSRYMIVEREDY